ncbi:hypothetical protein ZHAS_00007272 [Anopheles sinensis]|uniref:Uncharacterized protein n=1 Tax=Anopheles sinensis TaxID=74873 RepID=A0A084VP05_ANOSI|nr:hypothetical protein ZHAS_00007272 [Anopheles sinensis]
MKHIPVEVKLVDFQLARYAPPALDVCTLITSSTLRDFRRNSAPTLLNTYYEMVKELLSTNGNMDIEAVLPRSEFDASCAHFSLAGLIETMLFSHLTLIPKRFAMDLLRSSDDFDSFLRGDEKLRICMRSFSEDITYQNRMTEIFVELIDTYCL